MSSTVESIINEISQRNNALSEFDTAYSNKNYCALNHLFKKKLTNWDKAKSGNAGFVSPICLDCAYDMAHKYYEMFGLPDEWTHERIVSDKGKVYVKILDAIGSSDGDFVSSDISSKIGIAVHDVSYYLWQLRKEGLLVSRKEHPQKLIYKKTSSWTLEAAVKVLVIRNRIYSIKRRLKNGAKNNGKK